MAIVFREYGISSRAESSASPCTLVRSMVRHLPYVHDPLFEFHRWKANLRILDVTEIKTVPHVPLSHSIY